MKNCELHDWGFVEKHDLLRHKHRKHANKKSNKTIFGYNKQI